MNRRFKLSLLAALLLFSLLGEGCGHKADVPHSETAIEISSDIDETGDDEPSYVSFLSDEELRAEELLNESLTHPNTLIASGTEDIYYLNGRTVDISKPSLALTYDDGPMEAPGNRIMDTLNEYGVRCTFFLMGQMIPYYPDEVRRMVAEGHEIGNHTLSHAHLVTLSADEIRSEVDKLNELVFETTGVTPTVLRVPYGEKNDLVLESVGMPVILWNVDSRDWATKNTESTIENVLDNAGDGDVVLLHELYTTTAEATETIVPTLIERGYQLVTVSELALLKGVKLRPGEAHYSF